MRHLASAQYWDRISNCPLDRVLTYKNLIYLLNLQFLIKVRNQFVYMNEKYSGFPPVCPEPRLDIKNSRYIVFKNIQRVQMYESSELFQAKFILS